MEKIWDRLDELPFGLDEYGRFDLVETNLVNVPTGSMKIKRDNSLEFTLTINSEYYSRPRGPSEPGTISKNDTFLVVKLGPYNVRFEYLTFIQYSGVSQENTAQTDYRFSNIEITQESKKTASYLIEWFYASEDFDIIFPDNLEYVFSDGAKLKLKADDQQWNFDIGGRELSHISNSVSLTLLNKKLFIFNWPKNGRSRIGIVYQETPEWEVRKKIADVLSFCFGVQFIHLGEADLTTDFVSLRTKHRNYFGNAEATLGMYCLPPTTLGRERNGAFDANIICSQTLEETASGILNIYDKYNLQFAFHLYNYGRSLPYYLSAGVLGTAFESLLNSYYSIDENKLKGNILSSRAKYRKLKSAVTDRFADIGIEAEECDQIRNKLPYLNQMSFKQKADRLFNELGLNFGDVEKTGWNRRNDSAHGNYFDETSVPGYIKDSRIIAGLTNRAILALSSSPRSLYFDYSSVGLPLRQLKDPQLKSS